MLSIPIAKLQVNCTNKAHDDLNMEDVLEVYKRPYDPKRPLICIDELPKQLLMNVHEPLPMLPGKPERSDYEYKRGGVLSGF